MSARRKLGEYTLLMKWEPNDRSFSAPWVIGGYRWSIRRTGRNRGGDDGYLHVFETPTTSHVGSRQVRQVSAADLGLTDDSPKSQFEKRATYDAVGLLIVRNLFDRHPNMTHYQELLAHAYVNALKSGAIDNNDLASAPERTQMLVDELLGVK